MVNQDTLKQLQASLAGIGQWLAFFAFIWLLSLIGLGWLVKSFFLILGLLFLLPVIGLLGLQWWLRRNLVENSCPTCGYGFVAMNESQLNCPSCGEPLKVEQRQFLKAAPPGTIDVQAVEVSSQVVEE